MTPLQRLLFFSGRRWTPLRLGSALALWLDASDSSTLFQDSALTTAAVADADPVGGWKDKSGNGRHLVQATTTKRGTLKLAIQNSRPVVRFDGVDDFLQKAGISFAQPITVLFVAKALTVAGSHYFIDGGLANECVLDIADATHAGLYSGVGFVNSAACSPGNWQLYTCQFNGASSAITINGGSDTVGNAGTNASTGLTVGGSGSGAAGAAMNADYGEVIVCQGAALSAPQLASAKAYLNRRWAIY